MREGDEPVKRIHRKSLRLLGTVGEPINPEAWEWYWRVVGDRRCPVVDTWWQTETGGILISPFPGAIEMKPGSATKPLPGIKPLLVDAEGTNARRRHERQSLPRLLLARPDAHRLGRPRALLRDLLQALIRGLYFTGDGCRRDEDGYYWITGRVDDVINVSGHRIGTAEVESSLVVASEGRRGRGRRLPARHQGQAIYAFVTLNAGEEGSDALRKELNQEVRTRHRRLRRAGQDPLHARASQDPLGQDHAPHPAQDRRGRDRRLRRHLDARRSDHRRRTCSPVGNEARSGRDPCCPRRRAASAEPGQTLDMLDFFTGKTHADNVIAIAFHGPHKLIVDSVGGRNKEGEFILIDNVQEEGKAGAQRALGPCSRRAPIISPAA